MPSILFVRGAGHAAWCWHEHFTPWFEARGYTVAAPDLPHHGDRDRRGLKTTPLSAYVDAVAAAAASLPRRRWTASVPTGSRSRASGHRRC